MRENQKPIYLTVDEAIAVNRFATHSPHPLVGAFFEGEPENPAMRALLDSIGGDEDLEPLRLRLVKAGFTSEDKMPNVVAGSVKKRPKDRSITAAVMGIEVPVIESYTRELSMVGGWNEYTVRASSYVGLRAPTLVKLLTKLGDSKIRIEHMSEFSGMTDGMEPVPEARRRVGLADFLGRSIMKDRSTRRISVEVDDGSIRVGDACDYYRIELATAPTREQRLAKQRAEADAINARTT